MREICERYGLPYNTGPLHKQFGSVVRKIVRLALPDRSARHGASDASPAPPVAPAARSRRRASAHRRLISARRVAGRGALLRRARALGRLNPRVILGRSSGFTVSAPSAYIQGMSILTTARMYLKRTKSLDRPTDIYAHHITLLDGGELDLGSRRGKPTLIVNTASKCGYTPQYAGLQALHDRFHDQGLEVIGFPSADFADQEYDDAGEIGEFCQKNYGVSFPLSERVSVRADPTPLWEELGGQPNSKPPGWNFTKYLIGGDGRLLARWATKVTPEDPQIVSAIESALPARA